MQSRGAAADNSIFFLNHRVGKKLSRHTTNLRSLKGETLAKWDKMRNSRLEKSSPTNWRKILGMQVTSYFASFQKALLHISQKKPDTLGH